MIKKYITFEIQVDSDTMEATTQRIKELDFNNYLLLEGSTKNQVGLVQIESEKAFNFVEEYRYKIEGYLEAQKILLKYMQDAECITLPKSLGTTYALNREDLDE